MGPGEYLAPVPSVGVVAEVRALVHEPCAVHVDDDAEGVGVLLVEVGDLAVAEGGALRSHATAWQPPQSP